MGIVLPDTGCHPAPAGLQLSSILWGGHIAFASRGTATTVSNLPDRKLKPSPPYFLGFQALRDNALHAPHPIVRLTGPGSSTLHVPWNALASPTGSKPSGPGHHDGYIALICHYSFNHQICHKRHSSSAPVLTTDKKKGLSIPTEEADVK